MKKTALTIGLFSLVVVATSFANPENGKSNPGEIITPLAIDGTGGQQTKNGKKLDVYSSSNSNKDKFQSFASDSQLTKSKIKLD